MSMRHQIKPNHTKFWTGRKHARMHIRWPALNLKQTTNLDYKNSREEKKSFFLNLNLWICGTTDSLVRAHFWVIFKCLRRRGRIWMCKCSVRISDGCECANECRIVKKNVEWNEKLTPNKTNTTTKTNKKLSVYFTEWILPVLMMMKIMIIVSPFFTLTLSRLVVVSVKVIEKLSG